MTFICPGNSQPHDTPRDSCTSKAVQLLRAGGVVAIPTDTVYGLAARAFDASAVARVFRIKGRDSSAPLPLLLADAEMMEQCISVSSEYATRLAETFWPGPLTIVVPKSHHVPDHVTSGGASVGLRVPDHVVPRALSEALGEPITGTSANRSGQPAITSFSELKLEMGSDLDYILDGGDLPERPVSTVVDLTGDVPRVLRQGGVSQAAIESALGIQVQV
ncbi:MAG: threonylcarbamoyl-AMP synthase [Chloroflexi bacterium]|nr:threonylcarbamoyl-AMP synthase [Chloroflexota bacterium]